MRGSDAPDGAFAFENLGPAIALFIVPRGQTPQLLEVEDIGADRGGTKRPTWGAASAVHDGWVYLYGTANPQEKYVFGYSLQVARVHPDDILTTSKWRYWDGSAWQRSAGKAATLIPASPSPRSPMPAYDHAPIWSPAR